MIFINFREIRFTVISERKDGSVFGQDLCAGKDEINEHAAPAATEIKKNVELEINTLEPLYNAPIQR